MDLIKKDQSALIAQDLNITQHLATESRASSTRRAYRSDAKLFKVWCESRGLQAMPATPSVVALFIGSQVAEGKAASTLNRRLAAIRLAHFEAGHESPTGAQEVLSVMKGARRALGTAVKAKTPATADRIQAMVSHCPDTLNGKRDKALILLGFAGAFRRSELAALTVEDLEMDTEGLRIHIRQSKTDQEGAGQVVPVPHGGKLRVIASLYEWLEASGIEEGAIFRPLNQWGHMTSDKPLQDRVVAEVVKKYAGLAGFDMKDFGGHSLRSGFLTSAAKAGASIFKMMDISRHKRIETLRSYVKNAELFTDHAGAGFL